MRLILLLFALLLGALPAQAEKRIALTFDDAPRGDGAFFTADERARRLVASLRVARVRQTAFFLNPGNIRPEQHAAAERRIAAYVRAGHVIANHSANHPSLSDTAADAYLANIDAAEGWLRGRPGRRAWFRFPFLDEGRADRAKRDAVRAGLEARGLRNGYVTVDGYDWQIDALAGDARRADKAIDRAALRDLYVETHVGAAEFFDALMMRAIGRSPAHVMLLHENDMAAMFVGDLVAALRARGWTIVTADAAYRDPLRSAFPDVPSAQGTLTEALAWERGLPRPRWYERNDTALLTALFHQHVLHEPAIPPR